MSYSVSGRDGRWPYVTIITMVWCAVVFLGVNLQKSAGAGQLHHWGMYSAIDIYDGAYWGLLTTAFVHYDVLHIAFNLYWLWLLGSAFEKNLGSFWLAVFIVVTAIVSSGVQLASGDIGIGLSGVGYALIGFCWLTRTLYPDFYRVANERIVQMFLLWFLFCVVTTYLHIMNIANFAHFGGLLAGLVAGAFVARPKLRIPLAAAGIALFALSIVPIFYNPLSGAWNVMQGDKQAEAGNNEAALHYYKSAFRGDVNPRYVWLQMATIYEKEGDTKDYKDAIDHVDPGLDHE